MVNRNETAADQGLSPAHRLGVGLGMIFRTDGVAAYSAVVAGAGYGKE